METSKAIIEYIKNNWLLISISLVICFLHIYKIDSIPRGLFVDETSIGYNAITIAESGKDEHGFSYPVFFKAFGEYKNPVYIYLTSIIFDLFGYSDFNLRFTSFIFFLGFYLGIIWFTSLVFKSKATTILTAFIAAFTPWIFTTSRVGFEVISQLTAFIYIFIFAYRIYFQPRLRYYTLLGLTIGISVYTYSTSRLVSFLLFGYVVLSLLLLKRFKATILISVSFLLTLIPYLIFSLQNPEALTTRFKSISYMYATDLSVIDKIFRFIENYLSYFDLTFLLVLGDSNLRHSSGFLGQIFIGLFIVFVVGLYIVMHKLKESKMNKKYFYLFLFLNLLLSPLAAALTNEESHALRSILMVNIIIIFGSYGINYLVKLKSIALLSIFIVIIYLESALFISHYFTAYQINSIKAFESYNLAGALEAAIDHEPKSILLDNSTKESYINALYYSKILSSDIPIKEGAVEKLNTEECYVYYRWNKEPQNGQIVFNNDYSLFVVKCN